MERRRGERWNALAVDLRDGRAELSMEGPPPGPVSYLLAHDD
jgi:hypothetical protein